MSLGSQIARFRKEKSMTQEALANALGVTNQAVSKWELDQSCPDIQLLPKLADLFGISLDRLFERQEKALTQPQVIRVANLPWEDDGDLRAVFYIGHTLRKHWRFPGSPSPKQVEFVYDGPALNVHSDFSVTCKRDVEGYVNAGDSVNCGNVGGYVNAGDGVNCGNVVGTVNAGDGVNCGNIGGNARAGDSIHCGDIAGDATAGDRVICNGVAGRIRNG